MVHIAIFSKQMLVTFEIQRIIKIFKHHFRSSRRESFKWAIKIPHVTVTYYSKSMVKIDNKREDSIYLFIKASSFHLLPKNLFFFNLK